MVEQLLSQASIASQPIDNAHFMANQETWEKPLPGADE
jgi:hypothetical protein